MQAAIRAGRDPEGVRVVAVAKTFPADAVVAALDAGVTDIGENRPQELAQKAAAVGDRARWHFVGHLQTNKVRQVVGIVALIHSIDRHGVADAVARRARARGRVQDVLIEVNVGGEATKLGVEPGQVVSFAGDVASLEGIHVRGLMTMPPLAGDPESSRGHFRALAALGEQLRSVQPEATELSMGMTRDFEVAIEEGATLVRIGEAIFGPRNP